MFDMCSCTVAIAGDVRAVVAKSTVTVPEIMLLQVIHGADAVSNIRVKDQWDTTSEAERDRLGNFYGDEKVVNLFQQFGELPKVLADARIPDELLDPTWNKKAAKPAKKKAAPKKRARTAKGHFVKDDPATPENEAYVEG